MTSVNTNASATTALRTLQMTSKALDTTQNRISTGLKIGEAKDNAAYWAISTSLKSDNKSLSTVKDALNLGAATVDTAYQGLNKAREVLDEIKSKLTSATQDGLDRNVIQDEIDALQDQLKSISTSSIFSGENWLSVDSSVAGYNASKEIVASFSRDANNAVSIGTVTVDTSTIKLYDASSTANGILDGMTILTDASGNELNYGGTPALGTVPDTQDLDATVATAGADAAGPAAATATFGTINRTAMKVNDRLTFQLNINGAGATPVSVNVDSTALGSDAGMIAAINTAIATAGFDTTATTGDVRASVNSSGQYVLTTQAATGTGATIAVTNVVALDGDGAAIVQATADGGLTSAATTIASGSSTFANSGSTAMVFAAVAQAVSDAAMERLIEFDFQYGNEVFKASLDEAAIAGITDATTMAAAIDTAIQASTRVGDGVIFSATYANAINADTDASVGYIIGLDPDDVTNDAVVMTSAGTGADKKIGISNINSYEVITATGVRGTANSANATFAADLGFGGFFAAGTETQATVASTFTLGTIASGDRITFDATYSNDAGVLVTEQITLQTNDAWDADTFAASLQSSINTAFGAGNILVSNEAGGVTTFTTVASGKAVAFGISNVVAVDGDGVAASVGGFTVNTATGVDAILDTAAYTETANVFAGTDTYDEDDSLVFNVAVDGGTATKVTINKATIDAALGTTDGVINSAANFALVAQQALTDAGITEVIASNEAGKLRFTKTTAEAGSVAVTGTVASLGGSSISVDTIDISDDALTAAGVTGADSADKRKAVLSAYISVVNDAINSITTSAAKLGSVASRIDMQSSFVDTLIDTIEEGVGNLVDADLSEESTRLQALQTKQQLGIQALSIANSSTQNVLSLFQ